MRISMRWYLLLTLLVGCVALTWARGSEPRQEEVAAKLVSFNAELPPMSLTSIRDMFPH